MNDTASPPRKSGYADNPGYDVHLEACPKRIRVYLGGEAVADSTRVMRMHETRHLPVYYFPRDDVRLDLLSATNHTSFCPYKGEASYWTVDAGGKQAENAVWSYEAPFPETPEIRDYMAFYWNRMERWMEEDEEVFVHARDPYVRLDVVRSRRPVEVHHFGRTVARSENALFLFETGLPTRYYLPLADVDAAILKAVPTTSLCPYKGEARYWDLVDGDRREADAVWSYSDPLPECAAIADHLCFYQERMEAILVDGLPVERPVTKWSKS